MCVLQNSLEQRHVKDISPIFFLHSAHLADGILCVGLKEVSGTSNFPCDMHLKVITFSN
jgi:hypothetical protein